MSRPRVFVSSTYYDLKHLRSALEGFIESLGFEPVLSEKGSIAYAPDIPLDESCYREIDQADIMVLIVGGRYGTERSGNNERDGSFFSRYNSITREEFNRAVAANIPLYILIEKSVHAEHATFDKNRGAAAIKYAHVDNIGVFQMMDDIFALPKNNPIFSFDRYHEIEDWLREQWAGLFRDLLRRRSTQEQLATLAMQIAELSASNTTLKRYIESLMKKESTEVSAAIIDEENRRREQARIATLREDSIFSDLLQFGIPEEALINVLRTSEQLIHFVTNFNNLSSDCVMTATGNGKSVVVSSPKMQMVFTVELIDRMKAILDVPPLKRVNYVT